MDRWQVEDNFMRRMDQLAYSAITERHLTQAQFCERAAEAFREAETARTLASQCVKTTAVDPFWQPPLRPDEEWEIPNGDFEFFQERFELLKTRARRAALTMRARDQVHHRVRSHADLVASAFSNRIVTEIFRARQRWPWELVAKWLGELGMSQQQVKLIRFELEKRFYELARKDPNVLAFPPLPRRRKK